MNFSSSSKNPSGSMSPSTAPSRDGLEGPNLRGTIEVAKTKRSDLGAALRKDYVCKTEYSRPQRSAHCLAWCAVNYPGQLVPWALTCMAINQYRKAPTSASKEVESLKSSAGSIRKILQRDYLMDLVSGPEITARAVMEDEDIARSALAPKARRLQAAHKSFTATAELIDPNRIKDPEMKRWVIKSVGEVMKIIGDEKFYLKLLPPKKPEKP